MLIQGVRNLQPTNERECRDVLTVVGDFGELVLEESDVWFKIVALPHLDGEEMMVVLLGHLARDVLSEKHFGYLLEVAERAKRQRVKPIR